MSVLKASEEMAVPGCRLTQPLLLLKQRGSRKMSPKRKSNGGASGAEKKQRKGKEPGQSMSLEQAFLPHVKLFLTWLQLSTYSVLASSKFPYSLLYIDVL